MNTALPSATVVIRSYRRLNELQGLWDCLAQQDHTDFECLIVDSTPGADEASVLSAIGTSDPRIRVHLTPPRGCAAASNEAVRQARGEVLVFVDDDDRPVGSSWLRHHLENYRDAQCLGVNGFMQYEAEHRAGPALVPSFRRWRMLSHGLFKQPRCYAYDTRRKVGIDYLMGGNVSLRKSAALRAGGWDEYLSYHNEHSLFLRLHRRRLPGEYLVYDPRPAMEIRKDVPGGLDFRVSGEVHARVDDLARYFVWVVGRECPARIYGLFPLFAPSFVLFSAIAGYELAAGRPVNPWRELLRGAFFAPQSLTKHLLASPPPRPSTWLASPPSTRQNATTQRAASASL